MAFLWRIQKKKEFQKSSPEKMMAGMKHGKISFEAIWKIIWIQLCVEMRPKMWTEGCMMGQKYCPIPTHQTSSFAHVPRRRQMMSPVFRTLQWRNLVCIYVHVWYPQHKYSRLWGELWVTGWKQCLTLAQASIMWQRAVETNFPPDSLKVLVILLLENVLKEDSNTVCEEKPTSC